MTPAFTEEEYAARVRRVRERMAAEKIDLLYVTLPEDICYLHGYQSYWYQANSPKAWAATTGTAVHVNSDKLIHFERRGDFGLIAETSVVKDVRCFPMDNRAFQPTPEFGHVDAIREQIRFLVRELRAEGWLPGRIGLEHWSYRPPRAVSQLMEEAFTAEGCTVVDGSDILRDIKLVKSPKEIEYVAEACRIADAAILAAQEIARPGMTELQVYGEVIRAMTAEGGESPALLQWGHAGGPAGGHALATRRELRWGDGLFLDICGVYNRYHGNVVRGLWLGEPPDGLVDKYRRAAGAFSVLQKTAVPGKPVADVNRALREYYASVGLWDSEFGPWVGGYELGLSFPPDWVGSFYFSVHEETPEGVIQENMVTNYESNFAPVELIDTLVYRADGGETLSALPLELLVIDR
jgi:Xaa-Pro dipeptidase